MLEALLILLLTLAPVPKETRTDDDVWAWYRKPKLEAKWLDDKEFQRLFKRGVEAGLFACDAGLWLYATDKPSLRFRRWFLESAVGPALSLPYSTPPLIVPGWATKENYQSWDD